MGRWQRLVGGQNWTWTLKLKSENILPGLDHLEAEPLPEAWVRWQRVSVDHKGSAPISWRFELAPLSFLPPQASRPDTYGPFILLSRTSQQIPFFSPHAVSNQREHGGLRYSGRLHQSPGCGCCAASLQSKLCSQEQVPPAAGRPHGREVQGLHFLWSLRHSADSWQTCFHPLWNRDSGSYLPSTAKKSMQLAHPFPVHE